MTRHAPQHAEYVTRKSNHSSSSNRSRNPWIQDRQYPTSTNTISSTNSLRGHIPAYCTLSGPGPPVVHQANVAEQQFQYYAAQPTSVRSMTMPRVQEPKLYPAAAAAASMERAPSVRTNPTVAPRTRTPKYFDHVSGLNSGCSTSRTSSDRPITPVSLSTTDGIVDPCGGHCRTFERCCRYLLQVLFMIGILVGVSLVLAAYWLHSQRRGGDQLVLVYIGVLMALVCTLLLSIQCSVELEVKRRKRNRRANAALITRNRNQLEVPLRELANSNRVAELGNGSRVVYNPSREMELPGANAYSQIPLLGPRYQYETQNRSCDEMSQSHNGIPWWRRHELEVTMKHDNIV